MMPIRTFALVVLLACVMTASVHGARAQTAPAQVSLPGIEQQMSTEEFKAAGLDKLSLAELARLNTWLGRTIVTETAKAAVVAKKKVENENRGFFNFGSKESISSRLSGDFRGFGRGRSYTLDNGQVWQQTDDATLAGVRLTNPDVTIHPSMVGNAWYLSVGHYNTRAKVERVK